MQNGAGTDGLQVAFNTTYIARRPGGPDPGRAPVGDRHPGEGTVLGVAAPTSSVNFDASGLLGGTYDGNIRILSNDPDEPVYDAGAP